MKHSVVILVLTALALGLWLWRWPKEGYGAPTYIPGYAVPTYIPTHVYQCKAWNGKPVGTPFSSNSSDAATLKQRCDWLYCPGSYNCKGYLVK